MYFFYVNKKQHVLRLNNAISFSFQNNSQVNDYLLLFNGDMGRHIDGYDGFPGGLDWRMLEELGRKNVTRVLFGERIRCVKYTVFESVNEEGGIS